MRHILLSRGQSSNFQIKYAGTSLLRAEAYSIHLESSLAVLFLVLILVLDLFTVDLRA